MKFNAVLRAQSKDPHLVSQCNEICRGNKYATSIHATNSCVLKLSKLTVACKVYRGIKVRERPAAAPGGSPPRVGRARLATLSDRRVTSLTATPDLRTL